MRGGLLALALLLGAVQAPQTPAQLLQQIIDAAKQLQAQLPPPPPPPTSTRVTTAAELVLATKIAGANITAAAGTYPVNLALAAKGVTLTGSPEAVLVPVDPLEPTLLVTGNDITVVGLTIHLGAPDRTAVVVGSMEATSAATQPHNVRFAGTAVVAKAGGHRGFELNGVNIRLERVSVTGFYEKGRDSQAVLIVNGPGPYAIVDSPILEASGENILVGGADAKIVGMNPSDITITGNTLSKPASYKTLGTVKNSFELKTGVRVLFARNIIDGWWPGVHQAPIQITPRNQDGAAPWSLVDEVIITANEFRNVVGGFALNVQGTDNEHPSGQLARLTIDHNLFRGSGALIQVIGGVSTALIIDHNTAPQIATKVFSFDRIAGQPNMLTPLTFTQNVVNSGTYGVSGAGPTAMGLDSLLAFCTLTDWSGNLIEATAAVKWPAGQTTLPKGGLAPLLDPVTLKLLVGTAGY